MISIIMPVYNCEKYVKRAINSILKSTYKNFELIIVDDGSNDNTRNILKDFFKIDSRIRIIYKSNGGSASARNIGLKNAIGDYICFVDADDFIHKEYLSILFKTITKYSADLVECDFYKYSENDLVIQPDNTKSEIDLDIINNVDMLNRFCSREYYLRTCVLWNKIFKKDLFNDVKFVENKFVDDEYVIYKLIYNAKKVVIINLKLYYYFLSENSQMRTKPNIKKIDIIDVLEKQIDFFERKKLYIIKEKLYYRYSRAIIDSINYLKKYFPNEKEKIREIKRKKKNIIYALLSRNISFKDKLIILNTLFLPNISLKIRNEIIGKNKISVIK